MVTTGWPWRRLQKQYAAHLEQGTVSNVGELTDLVAKEFSGVGGSMGALCYVLVEAVGRAATTDGTSFSAGKLAHLLAAAEDAVTELGGARRGDKTIVDAIGAAREAAIESEQSHQPTTDALLAAAAAADQGATSTAQMPARVGRASRLAQRSIGTVDPGARSFAIVLAALARSYAQETTEA